MAKKVKINAQNIVDVDNGGKSISQIVQQFDTSNFVTPETDKDTTYSAGDGINIDASNRISVTTKYTAGTGINITNGVISTTGTSTGGNYDLPSATNSVLGGVKIGSNITSSTGGVISVPNANASTAGVTKLYTSLGNQTDGTLNLSVLSAMFAQKLNESDAAHVAEGIPAKVITDCNSDTALRTGWYQMASSDVLNRPWENDKSYPHYMLTIGEVVSGKTLPAVTQFAYHRTANKIYSRLVVFSQTTTNGVTTRTVTDAHDWALLNDTTATALTVRPITDCNSALETGFYRLGSNLQNRPWTHTHYPQYMVVFNGALSGYSNNGIMQFAFDITNNKFYTRAGTLGTSSVVTTDETTGSSSTSTVTIGNFLDWKSFVNEIPSIVSSATNATNATSATKADSATRDGNGNVITSTYLKTTGNAATASKWASSRTIALSGHVTGSVALDGSGNVTLDTTLGEGTTLSASAYGYNATSGTLANLPNTLANGIYYVNPTYWTTMSALTEAPYSVGSKAMLIQVDCGAYSARYLHFPANCPYICYQTTSSTTWPTTWHMLQTLNVGKPSTAKKGALYLDIDNHAIMMYNGSNWVATRNP